MVSLGFEADNWIYPLALKDDWKTAQSVILCGHR
jgi:hypothetical protein